MTINILSSTAASRSGNWIIMKHTPGNTPIVSAPGSALYGAVEQLAWTCLLIRWSIKWTRFNGNSGIKHPWTLEVLLPFSLLPYCCTERGLPRKEPFLGNRTLSSSLELADGNCILPLQRFFLHQPVVHPSAGFFQTGHKPSSHSTFWTSE